MQCLIDWNAFHGDFTYALANLFESNRWYVVSLHKCAKIGASRSSRLFVVYSCILLYWIPVQAIVTDDDDDEVFVLGPLHDEMMEDLLQGGCYK